MLVSPIYKMKLRLSSPKGKPISHPPLVMMQEVFLFVHEELQ
jgi:hypothetical protein